MENTKNIACSSNAGPFGVVNQYLNKKSPFFLINISKLRINISFILCIPFSVPLEDYWQILSLEMEIKGSFPYDGFGICIVEERGMSVSPRTLWISLK